MKYVKDIKPYNRFWGNCITNMVISIILKIDPSYEPLIYLNAYEYSIFPSGGLHLNYSLEYYNLYKDILDFERCNFIDRKNFLEEFKNILINNSYVTLNVDLFHWFKGGAFFNKVHRPHFSFIVGFDDTKNVFYVLEDDVDLNYGIKEIPTASVLRAFNSEHKNNCEDYRIITFKSSNLKPYILNINQILLNAKKIIITIEDLTKNRATFDKDTILNDVSNVHFLGNEMGKISHRLTGNILLFEDMLKIEMISKAICSEFSREIQRISKQWKIVQIIFLKYYFSNRISEIDKIRKMIIDILNQEKEMWLKFIDVC